MKTFFITMLTYAGLCLQVQALTSDQCNPAVAARCVCATIDGQFICKKDAKSTNDTATLKDISNEDLIRLLDEIEGERQQIIGTYYAKEVTEIEQNTLFANYYKKFDRVKQLQKLKALQDRRAVLYQQMSASVGGEENEPFYSLNQKLLALNEEYKKLEHNYLKGLETIEKKVEEQVQAAQKRLSAQGFNDDWELFQLSQVNFATRMAQIQGSQMSQSEKNKAILSLEANLTDIQNMAISVAAIKHLRCEPHGEVFAGDESSIPTQPESYTLFRSGAAMFIAAQINQTSDQKLTIETISKHDLDPQKSLDQQIKNLKLVALLNEQQISSVDLRGASKKEAFQIFQSAYEMAQNEYITKSQKLQEVALQLKGAKLLLSYHKKQEKLYCKLLRYCKNAFPFCSAFWLYDWLCDDHKRGIRKAKKKIKEWRDLQTVYEKHGHLKCRAVNVAGLGIPKTVLGYKNTQATAAVDTGAAEQGLAMKAGTENFKLFMQAKKVELFNSAAASNEAQEDNCPGKEIAPRGQVQAFPYPCHRAEYLSRLVSITQDNKINLETSEKDTAIDRRNTYVALLHHTKQRLSIDKNTVSTGTVKTPQTQVKVAAQVAKKLGLAPAKQNITFKAGLMTMRAEGAKLGDAIKANEKVINKRLKKNHQSAVNFANRQTQQKINSRRALLKNLLKISPKNGFYSSLQRAGGSFNKEQVAVANQLNGKSAAGRSAGKTAQGIPNKGGKAPKTASQLDTDKRDKLVKKLLAAAQYKGASGAAGTRGAALGRPSSYPSKVASGRASRPGLVPEQDDTALSKVQKNEMLKDIQRGTMTKIDADDTIFKKVTKSYFKTYPVLLDLLE